MTILPTTYILLYSNASYFIIAIIRVFIPTMRYMSIRETHVH